MACGSCSDDDDDLDDDDDDDDDDGHGHGHGRSSWEVGVLTLLKICRRSRVCFDPLKCHILSLETVAL